RRLLARRAAAGDVLAAWRMLQHATLDLGAPVPAAESPRAFGSRLVTLLDAPAAEVSRLVTAVERASYAPTGAGATGTDLAEAAETVRAAMLAAAPTPIRLRALLLPRSLVIRPGSALAGSAPVVAN